MPNKRISSAHRTREATVPIVGSVLRSLPVTETPTEGLAADYSSWDQTKLNQLDQTKQFSDPASLYELAEEL